MIAWLPIQHFSAGITALFHALILTIVGASRNTRQLTNFSLIVYSLNSLSTKSSAFYSLVLAVVRTINIMLPFYNVRKGAVRIAAVGYPIVCFFAFVFYDIYSYVQASIEGGSYQHYLYEFVYVPINGKVLAYKVRDSTNNTNAGWIAWAYGSIILGIPFILPTVICLVCLAIQVQELLKTKNLCNEKMQKDYRKMTVTILQLTALYVACNISFSIYYWAEFDVLLASKNVEGSQGRKDDILDASYGVCILIPIIGAAVEPIILLNGSSIRRYVRNKVMYWFYIMTLRKGLAEDVTRKYENSKHPVYSTYKGDKVRQLKANVSEGLDTPTQASRKHTPDNAILEAE